MSTHMRGKGPHKYNDPFYPGEKVRIGREMDGRIEWDEGLYTIAHVDDAQCIFIEDAPIALRAGDFIQSVTCKGDKNER